ncbi:MULTISPECIES: DUF58 domain-containing protein [Nocardiopsis]|uniref:DUF58 domain-containing protein n=1 Tax=Nocardiopsis sinuspersici TaxID=501010 RepID=A0A1V3BX46_9ACTN|nr:MULTISPECIES: DUF58 domain-containing protein [Nocardiopsis]OOC53144.1 hypothetical protein NOSIN_04340 [Nocardiopsis sinuspersici]
MRPHRTLTARGVCMLVLGLVALVSGLAVGQREIVGVGVLLVSVPPLSALTVLGGASRLVHSRTMTPTRVRAGHDARVQVRVGNSSPAWPVTSVSLSDTLPVPLGAEPRYTVGYLGPRAVRDVSYLVRPAVRGSYPVGPLQVGVTDPLGCVQVSRCLGAPSHLLVTPATVPLGTLGAADGAKGDDSPRRSVSGVGEQDPVPREYRYGDDLRKVHWRSTAKHGELMVRRDEQHWRENSAVLLDTRRRAHGAPGPSGSLETAVSVAASVAVSLLGDGHDLRLHTERGGVQTVTAAGVLDGLALTEPSDAAGLLGGIGMLANTRGTTSLVVAVLGAVGPEEAAALSRTGGNGIRVAVLCAHAAWPDRDALAGVHDVLATAGWRVIVLSSATELPPLWSRATGPAAASTARTAHAGPHTPGRGPR